MVLAGWQHTAAWRVAAHGGLAAGATAGSKAARGLAARCLCATAADCRGRAVVAVSGTRELGASAVGGSPSPARGKWATPRRGVRLGGRQWRLGVSVRLKTEGVKGCRLGLLIQLGLGRWSIY